MTNLWFNNYFIGNYVRRYFTHLHNCSEEIRKFQQGIMLHYHNKFITGRFLIFFIDISVVNAHNRNQCFSGCFCYGGK